MSAPLHSARKQSPSAPGTGGYIAYEKKAAVVLGQISSSSEKYIRLHNGEKIPHHRVWIEKTPPPGATLEKEIALAGQQLTAQQLWQAADGRTLTLAELTAAAAAGEDTVRQIAVLRQVLANPIYFRRHNRRISAVEAVTVQKALHRSAQRQQEQQKETEVLQQLQLGKLPPAIQETWHKILYTPDKNALPYRTLIKFLGTARPAVIARFFIQHGLLTNALDYLDTRFINGWNTATNGANVANGANGALAVPPAPAPAAAEAISIDDAGTLEIDDAFSLVENSDGSLTVGIHIAAAALFITGSSAADATARRRLTSVYFPHQKHFMLPPDAIAAASLAAGEARPAVSLYLTIHPASGHWQVSNTTVDNLRLAHTVTPEDADSGKISAAAAALLGKLKTAADTLAQEISCPGENRNSYKIDSGNGSVSIRPRGGASRTVEIFMRCANSVWAARLAGIGGGLFRDNGCLKTQPGAIPYMWLTSPLRRYVDLANQRLLLADLGGGTPPPENWRQLQKQFNQHYMLAQNAQRMMETYWALRILAQQQQTPLHGSYLGGRKRQVQLRDYPLTGTLTTAAPLPPDTPVSVAVDNIDLLEQRLSLTLCDSS